MNLTLPPLPEWTKMDDLGGKVPSEVRTAFYDYGRQTLELSEAATTYKSFMYAWHDETDGKIYLSAYKNEDDMWENNHIVLGEFGKGQINKHGSALTILGNVLAQAGVYLTIDN